MGSDARQVAIEALVRIEGGAYANLLLPKMLAKSGLSGRDRAFVTELVHGTTRRRRAHDFVIDQFVKRTPPASARAALRVGAHQLLELHTPAHAAVSATVEATPKKWQAFVNAVLRKVADVDEESIAYPSLAVKLSYPDWIVDVLEADLGAQDALNSLQVMNLAASVHRRDDSYVQDPSSTQVADLVPSAEGDLVLDVCAAPGGKATSIASRGATVVAVDNNFKRAKLMASNAVRLGSLQPDEKHKVLVVVANGNALPFESPQFNSVLVDAPCSGLGALRRRPDARWRIQSEDSTRLSDLQVGLLQQAAKLVAKGGTLIYSVCTLTKLETTEVAERVRVTLVKLGFASISSELNLPNADQDGMFVAKWQR